MSMRAADVAVAAIFAAVGVVVGLESWSRGSGWGPDGPRSGFFPFLMALVVVGGCLVVMIQALRGGGTTRAGEPLIQPGGLRPVLTVFLPAAGMVMLTEVVGLYLAAMVYLVGYIRWVGGFRWRAVLPVGILVPLTFYVLFDRIFLIPMPRGMLGDRLPF